MSGSALAIGSTIESAKRTWRRPRVLLPGILAAAVMAHALNCNVTGYTLGDESEDRGAGARSAGRAAGDYSAVERSVPAVRPQERLEVVAPVVSPAESALSAAASAGGKPGLVENRGPLEIVCPDEATVAAQFFFSPQHPVAGKPLRVVAIVRGAGADADAALETIESGGPAPVAGSERWGGPPYAWSAVVAAPVAGSMRFVLASADPERPLACGEVLVAAKVEAVTDPPWTGVWRIERKWDRRMEDFYAAWIGRLFEVEPGAKAGWRPLHQVLRDAKRNILYGHLGMREDDPEAKRKAVSAPDCADTPFFLRAYFAWKMRLPFAFRDCLRGNAVRGPSCDSEIQSNLTDETDSLFTEVERFNKFLAMVVAHSVHSGTVRTVPDDPASDFYPIALSRDAIRQGSVFADPNGHVLVITKWLEGTETTIGTLYAIDAHPDRTVSHKRFSPANFYFAAHLRTGGFKAFRPAVYQHGEVRFMTNEEMAASPDYGDFSLEQYGFEESAEFYRRVDKLLNPLPLDPVGAYRAKMEALVELLEERVSAVQVGIDYMNANGWAEVAIPEGGAIFETMGAWEDYSTPARDLRMLLAVDDFVRFPRSVQDHPDLFRIPAGKTMANVRADMDAAWEEAGRELGITYVRSDGSEWTLSLAEVVARTMAFEQAYNPNDCPEVRWGAEPGSAEFGACSHRTTWSQRLKMASYRFWHAERRRPSAF